MAGNLRFKHGFCLYSVGVTSAIFGQIFVETIEEFPIQPSTQAFSSRLLDLARNFMTSPNDMERSLTRKPVPRSLRVLRARSREKENAWGLGCFENSWPLEESGRYWKVTVVGKWPLLEQNLNITHRFKFGRKRGLFSVKILQTREAR